MDLLPSVTICGSRILSELGAYFDGMGICMDELLICFFPKAAIFNASGGFLRAPFLELPEETFTTSLRVSANGGFNFSQATLPLLLAGVKQKSKYPPSLIFTGATASVKSNAQMASFATGKWALRALSQSLAREFGPQGVHVSHAIIDGVIDIPRTKEWLKDAGPEAKLSADGVSTSVSLFF
jgi:NAD(P)-dependent dehydrogenase (short-subunit alcohol dehydrogenase family)